MKKMEKKNKQLVGSIIFLVVVIGIMFLFYAITNWKTKPNEKEETIGFYDISYQVPSEFDEEKYSNSRYYHYHKNSISCTFDITAYEKRDEKSLEKWFKGEILFTLNDQLGELEELEVNGNKLFGIEKKSGEDYPWDEVEHYYGIETPKYYYMLEYRLVDYKNGDREEGEDHLCLRAMDTILSSIETK